MKNKYKCSGAIYRTKAQKYLSDAKKLLVKKDYTQASEKLWGAAAQTVKAVAESKNWQHNGHSQLFKIVDKITKTTNDEEFRIFFQIANQLHINFYENWLTKNQVIQSAKDVEKLIKKLENLVKQ